MNTLLESVLLSLLDIVASLLSFFLNIVKAFLFSRPLTSKQMQRQRHERNRRKRTRLRKRERRSSHTRRRT